MKPLTPEMLRILWAANDRRLVSTDTGRWKILDDDNPPDRRARERLKARQLIWYARDEKRRVDYRRLVLTEKGYETLIREAGNVDAH